MTMKRRAYYSRTALANVDAARAAIRTHDYIALNTMLAQGLNPNIPGADGKYLVHDAVIYDADGTALDILAHYHADMNVQWASYFDWTPAHVAWSVRRMDIIEKLRGFGADLSIEDTRGWSASRALPCPITRKEAERKFGNFANIVSHTTADPSIFA